MLQRGEDEDEKICKKRMLKVIVRNIKVTVFGWARVKNVGKTLPAVSITALLFFM